MKVTIDITRQEADAIRSVLKSEAEGFNYSSAHAFVRDCVLLRVLVEVLPENLAQKSQLHVAANYWPKLVI